MAKIYENGDTIGTYCEIASHFSANHDIAIIAGHIHVVLEPSEVRKMIADLQESLVDFKEWAEAV
jgi:hypothetical protein